MLIGKYSKPEWRTRSPRATYDSTVSAKKVLKCVAKAWDMRGIDDPLTHAADRADAGQMPYGLMSADRL
jgi:hypothetical protein